jgi:hypothetical protein
MSVSTEFSKLAGRWKGTNKLWLEPSSPVRESDSILVISLAGQGKFGNIQYTWADDGKPQDGLLIIGCPDQSQKARATWLDSWHMQDNFMVLDGSMDAIGGFSVLGSYEAPPGPNWGWRISMEPQEPETLRLRMFNILPDGHELLAVETIYKRFA